MSSHIDALRIELGDLLEDHTYESVAEMYEVNKGIIWKLANTSYEPQSEELRLKLGLPERITIEAVRDEKGRFS